MRLGQWTDEKTLTRCYAHLNDEDVDAEIARGGDALTPTASPSQLAAALDEAHRKALEIRGKNAPTPMELAAAARVLQNTAAALEHAAGMRRAAAPSKFRDPAHYAQVDQKLRAVCSDGSGLNELLGYEVLADPKAERARPPAQSRRTLARLRARIARSSSIGAA